MPSAGPDNFSGQGLRVLLGEISETVAVVDASGRIVISNDSAATGDRDQLLGEESPGGGAVSSGRAAVRVAGRWNALMSGLHRVGCQLRGAIHNLSMADQEKRTFADLLADVVSAQAELAGATTVRLRGESALPGISLGPAGSELLRIVREAITNARRRSGGTTVAVDAGRSTDRAIRIDIADDGVWLRRRAAVRDRRTAGMFDWAERLGARLRIAHGKGGGTRVAIELPLAGRPDDSGARG